MYELGSILQRPLDHKIGKFIYKHIGLYIGEGRVIHFNGESFGDKESATIEEISLADFAPNGGIKVRVVPKVNPEGVVARAREILSASDNGYNNQYCLLRNNCEGFTRDCYLHAGEEEPITQIKNTVTVLKVLTEVATVGYVKAKPKSKIGKLAAFVGKVVSESKEPAHRISTNGERPKLRNVSSSVQKLEPCPQGHGSLRLWEGQPRCWKCGWTQEN